MLNKIIFTLPSENTIKLTDHSFWVTLSSKGNSVEGKLYFPAKITDKLVFFEPGFPGGGSTQFEELWLSAVLKEGYAVFLVRHSGTIINGKFSANYLNCSERQKQAKKRNQKIIGIKKSPTISDWLIEPKTAVEALGSYFKEIYLVGHSFGLAVDGLAGAVNALLVLLIPLTKQRPMLVAALCSGATAVVLRGMPLRLGLIVAIVVGILAGFAAEHWSKKGETA